MRRLIGRNAKRVRLEKKLSQEQLGVLSGFTQQWVSGLEKGKRNPTIISLYELALALEVPHTVLTEPDEIARQEDADRDAVRAEREALRIKANLKAEQAARKALAKNAK